MLRSPIASSRRRSHSGEGPTFTPRITAPANRAQAAGGSRLTLTPSTMADARAEGRKGGKLISCAPGICARRNWTPYATPSSRAIPLWPRRSGRGGGTSSTRRSSSSASRWRRGGAGGASGARRLRPAAHRAGGGGAEPRLAARAEHPLGHLAPELPLLDDEAARERRADRREGVLATGHDVGCTTDHLPSFRRSVIHRAEVKPVGVRMRPHLLHQRHDDVAEAGVERDDRVHRRAEQGEPVHQLTGVERAAQHLLQPAAGGVHAAELPASWRRKRMSPPYSSRMSGMPKRCWAVRPGPMPNAQPV